MTTGGCFRASKSTPASRFNWNCRCHICLSRHHARAAKITAASAITRTNQSAMHLRSHPIMNPLESSLVGYQFWRGIGNDALIGGLIAEVAVIAFVSEGRRFKRSLEFIAAFVVLVGVGIEVQLSRYADNIERQIRQQSNERVSALDNRTETLRGENLRLQDKLKDVGKEIALANVRVKEADLRIAGLKLQAATARKQIAEADARAQEANSRIAEANEKAESERLARVKLERAVSWRSLTDEQSHNIALALRSFAGEQLDVFAYRDEPDALILAAEIASAVGWTFTSTSRKPTEILVWRQQHWWSASKLDLSA